MQTQTETTEQTASASQNTRKLDIASEGIFDDGSRKSDAPKVVIVVDGGNVQGVYASQNLNVVIVDHDNLRENFSRDEREMIEDTEVNTLQEQITEAAQ